MQSYRFGAVEVRAAERRVLVEGRPATLGGRAFDVLLALIDRRDRVVTKDELLEIVWPGLVVEENNLQVQVSALRKILGAGAVATIPGRGYRFTLEPESAEAAPSCPVPAPRHNLPMQLSSFIGRERPIREVAGLLERARLVTLTGAGGTGKTRLSLQVASGVLERFPDGAWFVELAPLTDESRIEDLVALVLGVKEVAGRPPLETLCEFVRARRLLIVLDNCEHALEACARVARALLAAGPDVRILASSRENLHVTGEAIYPVPALAIPGPQGRPDPSTLADFEAVRLFVDRAQSVQPAFRLAQDNAPAVAAICRRLDGIPLAIELAAARTRAISVERIALLLDDCFRVLAEGDRTALPRQQTLRASIDWSYDLLPIAERMLLRRLAVFHGGWTIEAAESVCAGGDVEPDAVLDLLSRLVEKSLVEADPGGDRYRLLETVRQYAEELLAASGEETDLRNRHFAHCRSLAESAKPQLVGPEQGRWLARLDLERENLLAAHAWAGRGTVPADEGLRLVSSTKHYWIVRGLIAAANRMTLEALARSKDRSGDRCAALFDAGQFGILMGNHAQARALLDESLAIARELGVDARIAAVLQPLSWICLNQGDIETARGHIDEALALEKRLKRPRGIAGALIALAQLHRVTGELACAQPLYGQAMEILRDIEDHEGLAIARLNLAMVKIACGELDAARAMLREVIATAEALGSRREGQSVLDATAGLAGALGRWEEAARFFGAAEGQGAASGFRRDTADEALLGPLMAKTREALGERGFAATEAEGRALAYEAAMAEARAWLERA